MCEPSLLYKSVCLNEIYQNSIYSVRKSPVNGYRWHMTMETLVKFFSIFIKNIEKLIKHKLRSRFCPSWDVTPRRSRNLLKGIPEQKISNNSLAVEESITRICPRILTVPVKRAYLAVANAKLAHLESSTVYRQGSLKLHNRVIVHGTILMMKSIHLKDLHSTMI